MKSLKQKLENLDAILARTKAPLVQFFNPGLQKEEITSFFQEHGIRLHPALVTMYEWHNGVTTVYDHYDEEVNLIPFGSFFNLQEMLQVRDTFREWAANDFEDLENYLPLLGTGESDMFLLNLTTGEILSYQPMIQINGELEFNSIETLIDCIIECFETGAYQVDPHKGIEIDMDKYFSIQEKHLTPSNT